MDHDAFPEELLRDVDSAVVDGDGGSAADLEFQAGGRDDEVRGEELPGVHFYARGGDALDGAGGDVRLAGAEGLEEFRVGVETEALFPGVVARVEMRIMRDILGEALLRFFPDQVPSGVREAAAEIDEELRHDEEFRADEAEDEPGGEDFCHPGGGGVDGGPREDVAGTPLEHGYVGGLFRQNGDEGDGGGAAADDNDLPTRVVVLFGPELRVDDRALELRNPGYGGGEDLVVVVVARAEDEEAGVIVLRFAIGIDLERPGLLIRGPVGREEFLMELHFPVDAVLGSGLVDVLPDCRALCDEFLVHPRPPGETEGVEVRVGADAGEAEEIPGAAHGIAGFEDGVAGIWELGLDTVCRVDAGDACADDDDVEVRAGGFGGAVHVGGEDRKVFNAQLLERFRTDG